MSNVTRKIENKMDLTEIKSLSDVPSAHEGNRQDYLVKKVLDQYYRGNESMRNSYFNNGSEYRNKRN